MKKAITPFLSACFFICLTIAFTYPGKAQYTFSKVYQDTLPFITSMRAQSIAHTYDNGYLIAGQANNDLGLVMKIDSAGNLLWNKQHYVTGNQIQFKSIIRTLDSNFILSGYLDSNNGVDFLCAKINSFGDTLWTKRITEPFLHNHIMIPAEIHQTVDSGYIIIGSDDVGQYIFTAKLDETGRLQWFKTFFSTSQNDHNYGTSIKQIADSGFVVSGQLGVSNNEDNAFLMKLSPSGNLTWSKRYHYPSQTYSAAMDAALTSDGFLLYLNADHQIVLLKTDTSGNILWQKKFNQTINNDFINYNNTNLRLHQTSDGSIVFVNSNIVIGPDLITKVDSAGNLIWTKQLTISAVDFSETDNGLLILGNGPYSFGLKLPEYSQIGIITIDSLGNGNSCVLPYSDAPVNDTLISTPCFFLTDTGGVVTSEYPTINSLIFTTDSGCVEIEGILEMETPRNFLVSPNPVHDQIKCNFNSQTHFKTEINIYDITERKILGDYFAPPVMTINVRDLESGIYFIEAIEGQRVVKKFVKE